MILVFSVSQLQPKGVPHDQNSHHYNYSSCLLVDLWRYLAIYCQLVYLGVYVRFDVVCHGLRGDCD